jgi:nitrous oxidase accessory protein NosD
MALLAASSVAADAKPRKTPTPVTQTTDTQTTDTQTTDTQTACSKWASPGGLDTNAGTQAAPYKNPGKLVASLSAGQVGCLRGGSYGAGEVFSVNKSNITLRSAPGETATLYKGTYIPNGANHVTLQNLKLDGTKNRVGTYGYLVSLNVTGDDARILGNEIVNRNTAAERGGMCVYLGESSSVIANRTLIQGNRIHGCGDPGPAPNGSVGSRQHGIYVNWAHDTDVAGNTVYNVSGRGIQLYRDADRTMIRGNVIDRTGTGIQFAGGAGYATDYATARNNVITNSTSGANIMQWWETGVGRGNVAKDNCLWTSNSIKSGNGDGVSYSNNPYRNPLYAGDYQVTDASCKALIDAAAAGL